MKTIVAAVLNGSLVFATAAGFLTLSAPAEAFGWVLATYLPSLVLAAGCAFVSIGGLEPLHAHNGRDTTLCAALAVAWTGGLVAAALVLISTLLPADWLDTEAAKAWLLAGTAAQAGLLAVLARGHARLPSRNLKLK